MSSNPAIELASAIQSASIKSNPSPEHDINPSTTASAKIPASISSPSLPASPSSSDIHSDIIKPLPRSRTRSFPPLPDFRFEQSYLASIKTAESNSQIAWITIRDQILLPLVQGVGWNLVLSGWRHWNRGTRFVGEGVGARIRRWWWRVNNWKVPNVEVSKKVKEGKNATEGFKEFWVGQFGSAQGD